jgi:hypothetical protein
LLVLLAIAVTAHAAPRLCPPSCRPGPGGNSFIVSTGFTVGNPGTLRTPRNYLINASDTGPPVRLGSFLCVCEIGCGLTCPFGPCAVGQNTPLCGACGGGLVHGVPRLVYENGKQKVEEGFTISHLNNADSGSQPSLLFRIVLDKSPGTTYQQSWPSVPPGSGTSQSTFRMDTGTYTVQLTLDSSGLCEGSNVPAYQGETENYHLEVKIARGRPSVCLWPFDRNKVSTDCR